MAVLSNTTVSRTLMVTELCSVIVLLLLLPLLLPLLLLNPLDLGSAFLFIDHRW